MLQNALIDVFVRSFPDTTLTERHPSRACCLWIGKSPYGAVCGQGQLGLCMCVTNEGRSTWNIEP
jgi:hypothetical protein